MTSWRITTSPMKGWSRQAVLTWALRFSTLPRHSRQSTIMQSTNAYSKVQVFMQSTCAIPQYRYKYLHLILILQVSWVVVGQDGKSLYCMHEVFVFKNHIFYPDHHLHYMLKVSFASLSISREPKNIHSGV